MPENKNKDMVGVGTTDVEQSIPSNNGNTTPPAKKGFGNFLKNNFWSFKGLGRIGLIALAAYAVTTLLSGLIMIPGIATGLALVISGVATILSSAAFVIAGAAVATMAVKGVVNLARFIFSKKYRAQVKARRQERAQEKKKNKDKTQEKEQKQVKTKKKDKKKGYDAPVVEVVEEKNQNPVEKTDEEPAVEENDTKNQKLASAKNPLSVFDTDEKAVDYYKHLVNKRKSIFPSNVTKEEISVLCNLYREAIQDYADRKNNGEKFTPEVMRDAAIYAGLYKHAIKIFGNGLTEDDLAKPRDAVPSDEIVDSFAVTYDKATNDAVASYDKKMAKKNQAGR